MLSKVPPGTSGRQQTVLAVPRQNLLLSLIFQLIASDFLLLRRLGNRGGDAAWYPGAAGRMAA